MPVTAKLSKAFYERLGEDIANELVEWFNLVDATYRSDLREINELNFARFDARVEQRLAQFESRFEQRLAQSEAKVEKRFVLLEARVDAVATDVRASLRSEFMKEINSRFDRQSGLMLVGWSTLLLAVLGLFLKAP